MISFSLDLTFNYHYRTSIRFWGLSLLNVIMDNFFTFIGELSFQFLYENDQPEA
jgi:hypothetical protein